MAEEDLDLPHTMCKALFKKMDEHAEVIPGKNAKEKYQDKKLNKFSGDNNGDGDDNEACFDSNDKDDVLKLKSTNNPYHNFMSMYKLWTEREGKKEISGDYLQLYQTCTTVATGLGSNGYDNLHNKFNDMNSNLRKILNKGFNNMWS